MESWLHGEHLKEAVNMQLDVLLVLLSLTHGYLLYRNGIEKLRAGRGILSYTEEVRYEPK